MSIPTLDKEIATEMLSNVFSCSQLVCEQVFALKLAVSEAHFPPCQPLPRITQTIRCLFLGSKFAYTNIFQKCVTVVGRTSTHRVLISIFIFASAFLSLRVSDYDSLMSACRTVCNRKPNSNAITFWKCFLILRRVDLFAVLTVTALCSGFIAFIHSLYCVTT